MINIISLILPNIIWPTRPGNLQALAYGRNKLF